MMSGWKTWIAVAGAVGLGVYKLSQGDVEGGITAIVGGLSLLGIGHKLDKNTAAVRGE